MKTVQVENEDGDIITSFTKYEDGIKGITAEGYKVIVDGNELKTVNTNNEDHKPDAKEIPYRMKIEVDYSEFNKLLEKVDYLQNKIDDVKKSYSELQRIMKNENDK